MLQPARLGSLVLPHGRLDFILRACKASQGCGGPARLSRGFACRAATCLEWMLGRGATPCLSFASVTGTLLKLFVVLRFVSMVPSSLGLSGHEYCMAATSRSPQEAQLSAQQALAGFKRPHAEVARQSAAVLDSLGESCQRAGQHGTSQVCGCSVCGV